MAHGFTRRKAVLSAAGGAHGAYFFSRVVQHGKRRAEEMREAAATVREAGFEPLVAAALADKQDWVFRQARDGVFDGVDAKAPWEAYADRLIERGTSEEASP